jgi:hypothetical protein
MEETEGAFPAVLFFTVLLFFYLDMEETEGTLYLSHTPSWRRRSLHCYKDYLK